MTQQITIEIDDALYQPLIKHIGKENLNSFFTKLVEPYVLFDNLDSLDNVGTNDNINTHINDDNDSILGFSQGSIEIIGDIVAPTTDDNEWEACQ